MTGEETAAQSPLKRLRVLDFTRALAGPFCTMILGDLGADVIKVEPIFGDMTRTYPPRAPDNSSTYFLSANRSKRSISIDFRREEGLAVLRQLARDADIVVENFRPGVMAKLKLAHADLVTKNPSMIYASVSGFGRGGPYEDWPGFDQIAQGMSGLMSVTGTGETGPLRVGIPIADLTTGMWTALGILAAAFEREQNGVGRKIDTSLLGGILGLMTIQAQRYLTAGEVPIPLGNDHAMISPYGAFEARDGMLSIGAGTEAMWLAVCRVLGCDELTSRPEYVTNELRVKNRISLKAELNQILCRADRSEWTRRLVDAGVPAGPVWTMKDVFEDRHVNSSQRIAVLDHPTLGTLKQVAIPISFDGQLSIRDYRAPPLLGQHTVEVLREHGFSSAAVETLISQQVVLQAHLTTSPTPSRFNGNDVPTDPAAKE